MQLVIAVLGTAPNHEYRAGAGGGGGRWRDKVVYTRRSLFFFLFLSVLLWNKVTTEVHVFALPLLCVPCRPTCRWAPLRHFAETHVVIVFRTVAKHLGGRLGKKATGGQPSSCSRLVDWVTEMAPYGVNSASPTPPSTTITKSISQSVSHSETYADGRAEDNASVRPINLFHICAKRSFQRGMRGRLNASNGLFSH